jgi:hypothetical protein
MLRDEGGRLADEESKVSFVDLAALRDAPSIHDDGDAWPPPSARRDPTPPPQPRLQRVPGSPPPTPPSQEEMQAKQAVIVGLAKANATGPKTRSKRPSEEVELGPGVRMKPGKAQRGPAVPSGSPPPVSDGRSKRSTGAPRPPPMFLDEQTRQVDPSMPLPAEAVGGRPLRRGGAPERFGDDFKLDDPTRHADVDPMLLAGTVEDGTLDEVDVDFLSATYQGDGADGRIDLGPREQSARYPKLEDVDEDATRMGDMRELVARERERDRVGGSGAGATSRKKPETRDPPRTPPPRAANPARPPGPVGHDDATRSIDVGRNQTLSDVDWDLD